MNDSQKMSYISKKYKNLRREYKKMDETLQEILPNLVTIIKDLKSVSESINNYFSIDKKGLDNNKVHQIADKLETQEKKIRNTICPELKNSITRIHDEMINLNRKINS